MYLMEDPDIVETAEQVADPAATRTAVRTRPGGSEPAPPSARGFETSRPRSGSTPLHN
jgi:hypothetical protein